MRGYLGHFTASGKGPPTLSRIYLHQEILHGEQSECGVLSGKKGKGREKPPPQGLNLSMEDKNSTTTGVEWGQCFQDPLNMAESPANASL